jgi:hypothetical protein
LLKNLKKENLYDKEKMHKNLEVYKNFNGFNCKAQEFTGKQSSVKNIFLSKR